MIHESCALLISGQREALRHRLARSFEHKRMKEAAQDVAGERSHAPAVLKDLAKTFVQLQQQRHDADYNLTKRFRRSEVLALLSRTEKAFKDWKLVRGLPETEIFLVSLLTKLR
jgi:hypothetical protein